MEKSPKVTVMIANYNGAYYLPSCLESMANQTFKDFEVLIIDDGSTDNSLDICHQYALKDSRFRIMALEKNQGVSHVRHMGLKDCKGEYIAILDADDSSLPNRLEKQVHHLDENPQTVLLGGYYAIIDSKGNILRRKKKLPVHDPEIRWRLTFGNCLIHSTVMYRKEEALKSGGYNPETIYALDMDLYTRIIAYGKVAVLPEVLSCWRSHSKSLTKTTRKEEYDNVSIHTVKQSILRHTRQDVDHDVAGALYHNSKAAAKSPEILINGFKVIEKAMACYNECYKTRAEKKQLARYALTHLFKINKRNQSQPWWDVCKGNYLETLRSIIRQTNYKWYSDINLFFPLFQFSPLHYFSLIRASLNI